MELGSATHATVGSVGPSLGAYPLLQVPVHTEPAGVSQHSFGSLPFSRLAVGGPRQAVRGDSGNSGGDSSGGGSGSRRN